MGGVRNSVGHLARATPKTPTPALPEGEGVLSDTNCELRALYRRQTIIHELQTTSYELRATYRSFRFPGRGRTRRPRSGAHAGREAWIRLLSTWNVGEGFKPSPTGKEPEAGQNTSTSYDQQSTSYVPRTTDSLRTSYALLAVSSPPPRTTHYAPRTYRADTRARPYIEINRATNHEPQLQATSYKPHAAISSFPPSEQDGSREPVQTGSVSGSATPSVEAAPRVEEDLALRRRRRRALAASFETLLPRLSLG